MIRFEDLTWKHLPSVAALHKRELPQDFCSLLGEKFLKEIFYPELLQSGGFLGLVACENTEVLGFVYFQNDPDFLAKVLKKHFLPIFFFALRNAVSPSFILYVLEVLILTFFRRKPLIERQGVELGYIAVSDRMHSKGIGQRIVREGISRIRIFQKNVCWVKTLAKGKTVNFYLKCGFLPYEKILGRAFLYIKISHPPL